MSKLHIKSCRIEVVRVILQNFNFGLYAKIHQNPGFMANFHVKTPCYFIFFKNLCPKRPFWRMVLYILRKKEPILATFWQFLRKNGLKLKFFMKTQLSRKMKILQKLRRCTLKIWNMFKIAWNHFKMFKSMRGTQF